MNNSLFQEKVMSVEQVAEILECTEETAAEQLKFGELPGVKFGRGWRVPAVSFYQRLNEMALEQAKARRSQRTDSPEAKSGEPESHAAPRKRPGRKRFNPGAGNA